MLAPPIPLPSPWPPRVAQMLKRNSVWCAPSTLARVRTLEADGDAAAILSAAPFHREVPDT